MRAAAALADFRGARRRLERLGETAAGAAVYDDYAHHPTEVAAAIAAARTLARGRVVAVFQPHLYSRTRALAGRFGRALAAADLVVVLPVYPARERGRGLPGRRRAPDRGGGRRRPPAAAGGVDAGVRAGAPVLAGRLRRGDVCLVMGAGDVDSLGRSLVA